MRRLSALLLCLLASATSQADSGPEILLKSRQALERLVSHADEAGPLLQRARGVLVFPDMVKMGFAVSGQYGEGVLLVDDEPAAYYAAAGASYGLQLTQGLKSEVILFFSDEALQRFRHSHAWEVGVNADVPVFQAGAAGADGLLGFIFSDHGLSPDLSLQGNRMVRIAR